MPDGAIAANCAEETVRTVRLAVGSGFNDFSRLQNEPALSALRNVPNSRHRSPSRARLNRQSSAPTEPASRKPTDQSPMAVRQRERAGIHSPSVTGTPPTSTRLLLSLRLEIRRRDHEGAAAGVCNSLPSEQLHARSRAGDGGGVPQVIARPASGRRAPMCSIRGADRLCVEVSCPEVNHANAVPSGGQTGRSERRLAGLQVGSAEAGGAGHERDGAGRIELAATQIGDRGGQNDRLSECRRPGMDRKERP